jgi:hypothetical protein
MSDRRDALRERGACQCCGHVRNDPLHDRRSAGYHIYIPPRREDALAAEPPALDWAMLDVIKADVERWRRDHPRTEWAPKPPADDGSRTAAAGRLDARRHSQPAARGWRTSQ